VLERVPLVTCPFRALLISARTASGSRLCAPSTGFIPHGRFVFDVFAPSMEDVEETNGR
jgi:hypothetical protein